MKTFPIVILAVTYAAVLVQSSVIVMAFGHMNTAYVQYLSIQMLQMLLEGVSVYPISEERTVVGKI
jgi:hypothetical protein